VLPEGHHMGAHRDVEANQLPTGLPNRGSVPTAAPVNGDGRRVRDDIFEIKNLSCHPYKAS
jgi:hypothetical protein